MDILSITNSREEWNPHLQQASLLFPFSFMWNSASLEKCWHPTVSKLYMKSCCKSACGKVLKLFPCRCFPEERYNGLSWSWAQKHVPFFHEDFSLVSVSFNVTGGERGTSLRQPFCPLDIQLYLPSTPGGQLGHFSPLLASADAACSNKVLRYLWPLSKTLERYFLWEFSV